MDENKDVSAARSGFMTLDDIYRSKNNRAKRRDAKVTYKKDNGLYFSTAAVDYMQEPDYVRPYFDPENRILSLESFSKDQYQNQMQCQTHKDIIEFAKGKENQKNVVVRWTRKDITGIIDEMIKDSGFDYVSVPLRYDDDAKWYVIDFKLAQENKRKEREDKGEKKS